MSRMTGRVWLTGGMFALLLVASCSGGGATGTSRSTNEPPSSPATSLPTSVAEPISTMSTLPSVSDVTAAPSPTNRPPRCESAGRVDRLVVWHALSSGAALSMLDQFADEYQATSGIPVELVQMNGSGELNDALGRTAVADWPNVVLAPDSLMRNLYDSGHFVRPGECGDDSAGQLLPAVRAHFEIDGELAAAPFGVSTLVLMLDRLEYAAAGLDPDAPLHTFDDLLATSAKIRASGASPHGLVVDDHCIEWAVSTYSGMRGEVLSPPANGHDDSPMDVTFASTANIATLSALQDAVDAGSVTYIGPNEGTVADLTKIIDPQDGATMTVHTSATLGDLIALIDAGSVQGVSLGVLPLPGPGSGGVAGGNALFLTDLGDPAVTGAGMDLIRWLTSPAQLARLDAATGYVPPDEATASDPALLAGWAAHPELRVGFDQLRASPGDAATAGLLIGPTDPVNSAGYAACGQLLTDMRPAGDVLADYQDVARQLIAAYRPTD